ncbi:MAG TPA: hypothetical protein ENH91_11050 [Leeuwenhoekiella sp.]|nr:hypothetical protein [Leeuwenhoekiella sp.]
MVLFVFAGCRETSTGGQSGDTMNGTTPSGDTTSTIDNVNGTDGIVTYKQGDMDVTTFMNQDMSQTYSELEMSDEQIKTYQSTIGASQADEQHTNQVESQEQRDKAMKSILTDVQYDKYKMMKKNTPKDGDQ